MTWEIACCGTLLALLIALIAVPADMQICRLLGRLVSDLERGKERTVSTSSPTYRTAITHFRPLCLCWTVAPSTV